MCKLFGQSPSSYLGIEDTYARTMIDLACAAGFWEDENQKYEDSKTNATNEAGMIGEVLEDYQKQLSER